MSLSTNNSTVISPIHKTFESKPPAEKISLEREYHKLDDTQIARLRTLLNPTKKFILTPKSGYKIELKPIEFTLAELLTYLNATLKDITIESAYLTGGAACHVLAELEFADIDLTFFVNSSSHFKDILTRLQKFVKLRCTTAIDEDTIRDFYFCNKKLVKGQFAFYGMGGIDLKFILTSNSAPCHLSPSDSFYIPIKDLNKLNESTAFCLGHPYQQALDALRHRELVIHDPNALEDLVFRFVHKMTQGFVILGPKDVDVFKIALDRLVTKYDLKSPYSRKQFKEKYEKNLTNHYPNENHFGKLINFLNFLSFLNKIPDTETRSSFCQLLAETWVEFKNPHVNHLAGEIQKDPKVLNDLLSILKGILLFDFLSKKETVDGYIFPFSRSKEDFKPYISITSAQRTHYVFLDDSPFKILENFFNARRSFIERQKKEGSSEFLSELIKDFGISNLRIDEENTPILIKTLLDGLRKWPLQKLLDPQIKGAFYSLPIFKVILRESKPLKEFALIKFSLNQQNIEFHLRREEAIQSPVIPDFLKIVLACLTHPTAENQKSLFNILEKQLKEIALWTSSKPERASAFSDSLFLIFSDNSNTCLESITVLIKLVSLFKENQLVSPAIYSNLIQALLHNYKEKLNNESAFLILKFIEAFDEWDLTDSLKSYIGEYRTATHNFLLNTTKNYNVIEPHAFFFFLCEILEDQNNAQHVHLMEGYHQGLSSQDFNTAQVELLETIGIATLKLFETIPIPDNVLNKIFELGKKLCQSKSDKAKRIGRRILILLIQKDQLVPHIQTFILSSLTTYLISDNTNKFIQSQFNKLATVLNEIPNITNVIDIEEIQELIPTKITLALEKFLIGISNLQPELATKMYANKKVKELIVNKKDVGWDLIQKLCEKKNQELEKIYELWSTESQKLINGYGIKEILITIEVATQFSDKPESSSQQFGEILERLVSKINNLPHDITEIEKGIIHKKILIICTNLISNKTQYEHVIAILNSDFLSQEEKFSKFETLINKQLENNQIVAENVLDSYLALLAKKANLEACSVSTIEKIIKLLIGVKNIKKAWKFIQNFLDKTDINFFIDSLKKYSLQSEYDEFEFCNAVASLTQDHFQQAKQSTIKEFLSTLINLKHFTIFRSCWEKIFKSKRDEKDLAVLFKEFQTTFHGWGDIELYKVYVTTFLSINIQLFDETDLISSLEHIIKKGYSYFTEPKEKRNSLHVECCKQTWENLSPFLLQSFPTDRFYKFKFMIFTIYLLYSKETKNNLYLIKALELIKIDDDFGFISINQRENAKLFNALIAVLEAWPHEKFTHDVIEAFCKVFKNRLQLFEELKCTEEIEVEVLELLSTLQKKENREKGITFIDFIFACLPLFKEQTNSRWNLTKFNALQGIFISEHHHTYQTRNEELVALESELFNRKELEIFATNITQEVLLPLRNVLGYLDIRHTETQEILLRFRRVRACLPVYEKYNKNMGAEAIFQFALQFHPRFHNLVSTKKYELIFDPINEITNAFLKSCVIDKFYKLSIEMSLLSLHFFLQKQVDPKRIENMIVPFGNFKDGDFKGAAPFMTFTLQAYDYFLTLDIANNTLVHVKVFFEIFKKAFTQFDEKSVVDEGMKGVISLLIAKVTKRTLFIRNMLLRIKHSAQIKYSSSFDKALSKHLKHVTDESLAKKSLFEMIELDDKPLDTGLAEAKHLYNALDYLENYNLHCFQKIYKTLQEKHIDNFDGIFKHLEKIDDLLIETVYEISEIQSAKSAPLKRECLFNQMLHLGFRALAMPIIAEISSGPVQHAINAYLEKLKKPINHLFTEGQGVVTLEVQSSDASKFLEITSTN